MAEAKLRKAIITSRYPTARDLAAFFDVSEDYVKRLAAELMDQPNDLMVGVDAGSTKKSRPRTTKKRA